MPNTLPVIGIVYYSMLVYIQKSLLFNKPELLEFDINSSNRRSSGQLVAHRFKKKQCLRLDISHLGVNLYNQLTKELTDIKNLKKFKTEVKKYLIGKIDLLLSPDQHKTRKIS
jgi:hypothetical protein